MLAKGIRLSLKPVRIDRGSDMSATRSEQDVLAQHRPLGRTDILNVIVEICEAEKAYRTISLFALMSKHHHRIIQPRLTTVKKRVVLDFDDIKWRNKDNDPYIE